MQKMTCALVERLQTIPDPRRHNENLKHPLVDLILLGFCGVLAGGADFVEIAKWGRVNESFLRTFLELPHGIPSHDTLTRVFAALKPAALQEVLVPWLLEKRGGVVGEWIQVDGKTLRGTRCQQRQPISSDCARSAVEKAPTPSIAPLSECPRERIMEVS